MKSGIIPSLLALLLIAPTISQAEETYAEKLGYPKGARVALFHSDDLGMHIDGNNGTIRAVEQGIVTSASTMMPCGWVTHWAAWLKENPDFDNGLHLTLTSEWKNYRWGPISGGIQNPGLVDEDGYMWHTVAQVVGAAKPKEVAREIRAQIAKARAMGIPVTHMDTHMGTLYGSEGFLKAYCDIGIKEQIPVMIMGGHMTTIQETSRKDPTYPQRRALALKYSKKVWDGGLPVLDDLYTPLTDIKDVEEKKTKIKELLRDQKPGVTMYIVHCTDPSPTFQNVSSSGSRRESDMLATSDPEIVQFVKDEGIILTTWKELHERRKRLGK
jgi:hypothetical protein